MQLKKQRRLLAYSLTALIAVFVFTNNNNGFAQSLSETKINNDEGGQVYSKNKSEFFTEKNKIIKHSNIYTNDGGTSTLYINQNNIESFSEKSDTGEIKIPSSPGKKNILKENEIVSIDFYDVTGKFVMNKKCNYENFKNKGNKEKLPFGTYLYIIKNTNNEIIETGKNVE